MRVHLSQHEGGRMSLLPLNSTFLERVLEAAQDHDLDPDVIRGVADSARCPANFLPWLGWSLKVEGWEAAYTDGQRREADQRGNTRTQDQGHGRRDQAGA